VTVLLYTTSRLHLPQRAVTVWLTAPNGRRASVKVWNFIDVLVLRELFLDQDYQLPTAFQPSTILDLGSNIGVSVRLFRALFPQARIIAVEPDPSNFRRLQVNSSGDDGVVLVGAAATVCSGQTTLYAAREGWVSSLDKPKISAVEIVVDGLQVNEILAVGTADRVDIVKVDIEGGEWDLLEAGSIQAVTDCIVGEIHHATDEPADALERLRHLLNDWELTVHGTTPTVSNFTSVRRSGAKLKVE